MREEVYDFIKKNEGTNWWYRARRMIFEEVLRETLGGGKSVEKLYEIGCGGGGNFGVWSKFSDFCVGVDVSQKALDSCAGFGYKKLILADAENLSEIPDKDASLIAACDVLEHISDDKKALQEMCRILKTEGVLFVTVPAFNFLTGGTDVLSLHKRRYTRKQLNRLLRDVGFSPVCSTYFNTLLFFPTLAARFLEKLFRLKPQIEYKPLPKFLNYLFYKIFSFEKYLLRYFNFPFGVSLMVIAKK